MDIKVLQNYVELKYSHRRIAKELNCSQTTVKYWLKKHGLKTILKEKIMFCVLCGRPVDNNNRNRSKCQTCTTRIRRYRMKQKAVELLGGKCMRCDWSGNIAAFEFHHPNNNKISDLSRIWNKSWKSLKDEVMKCELLCSNCHKTEHTKYDKDENFMMAVKNYNIK
jgi:hypothetical protein